MSYITSLPSLPQQVDDLLQQGISEQPSLEPFSITARYEQLSHIHPKVGATGVATANAFLFQHGEKKYIVTAAHTLVANPMHASLSPMLPVEVKLGRDTLGPMAYSRFFDVAIFDASHITGNAYTQIDPANHLVHCTARYKDPNSSIQLQQLANYTTNIRRRTQAGVFLYKLMDGSSGSAISKDGKLVGMVSGCDQQYDNLTVCVPAQTILDIVSFHLPETWNSLFNIDEESIFPEMITVPISEGLRTYFPDVPALSHVVMYSKTLRPLTMIEPHVANKALQGNKKFDYRAMTSYIQNRWFAFPRQVVMFGNGALATDDLSLPKSAFVPNMWNNVVYDGMNVVYDGTQMSKQAFEDLPDATDEVLIVPFSSMYDEFYNYALGTGIVFAVETKANPTPITTIQDGPVLATVTDDQYRNLVTTCLVRHWAFVVIAGLSGVGDVGYQLKVFATECNRLKEVIGENYELPTRALPSVLNKLVEFQDLMALSFFQVFAKVFNVPYSEILSLMAVFPLKNFNNLQSNAQDWYTLEIQEATLSEQPITLNGTTITNDVTPIKGHYIRIQDSYYMINTIDSNNFTTMPALPALAFDAYYLGNDELTVPKTLGSNVIGLFITYNNQTYRILTQDDLDDGYYCVTTDPSLDKILVQSTDPYYFLLETIGNATFVNPFQINMVTPANIQVGMMEATLQCTITALATTYVEVNYDLVQLGWRGARTCRFLPIDSSTLASTLPIDEDGNCSFNLNGLEVEHYNMVPNMAQALTAQRKNGADNQGVDLELVYHELSRLSAHVWDTPYYPHSFQVVKSMWDHSHNTMANLLPFLGEAFATENSNVSVQLTNIPATLQAWPMLESKVQEDGDCR